MALISDILKGADLSNLNMIPGTVLLGEMAGVEHLKFYIIAAVSVDKVCACSVVINSAINPFIMRRPWLLSRQVQILARNYDFLSHDSFVNCAQPLKGKSQFFMGFKHIGQLHDEDLKLVRKEIVNSGMLTADELRLFQLVE